MKTWAAIQIKIQADIASGTFGEIAPGLASQLLNEAKKSYEKSQE